MTIERKSYRQIFQATSIFGGVQVFNVLISIVRLKFVAILLGPVGLGITGLYTATTGFITALTNMGLGISGVKNVAAEAATGNKERVSLVVTVLRRLVWITGLLGMCMVIIFSPMLSKITFGNDEYVIGFLLISVSLLIHQLNTGQRVVLQALRKLVYLAKANMFGALAGLLIALPIYYIWRLDGIVPVLIVSAICALFFSWYYSKKVGVNNIKVTRKEIFQEGQEMVKTGFLLSMSSLVTYGVAYLTRVYISDLGGIEQVGLFTAGFTLVTRYVGMVLEAMGTDYYPRLCGVAENSKQTNDTINQQAEVAILILSPILSIFLIFINFAIILLYTKKFLVINEMIYWAAIGMYFKSASWSITYVFLAKGDSKLFFSNEALLNLYLLIFNVLGYRWAGLEGLGIAILLSNVIYLIQVYLIAHRKYDVSFSKQYFIVGGLQFTIGLVCFGLIRFVPSPWNYLIGSLMVAISVYYSFKELEKRMGIIDVIKNKFIKR